MRENMVRIYRLYEFVGDRAAVEEQVQNSIHGRRMASTKKDRRVAIIGTTLGVFPEILSDAENIRANVWWDDEANRVAQIRDEAFKTAVIYLESLTVDDGNQDPEIALAALHASKLIKARFDIK